MPLIIKTAGVTIYGSYVLLASLLGFLFGISSLGVGFRCRRLLPATCGKEDRRTLFYPQLFFQGAVLSFLILLFVLLGTDIKEVFLKNKVNFSLLPCCLYLLAYMLYSQTAEYFRYTNRIKNSMIQIVIGTYIPVGIILGTYFFFRIINVNILIISETASAALVAIPIAFIILRETGFSLSVFNFNGIIRDIKLGFPLVISYVVDTVLGVSDRYLLALFLTVTDIGYYNPGYAVGALIAFVPRAFGMVLPQFLSRSVDAGREEEARAMLNYALKGFLLLAIPFIVGASALSKPLLNLLGNEVVAQKAFLVTPFVATGMLFYGLYITLSNVLFVRMKTGAMLRMNAIVAFLSLTLNCILLYFFRSILMTAITALISFFVVFILMLRVVRKEWRVDFDVRAILKSVISALVMGGVLYWMSQLEVLGAQMFLNILGNIVIGVVVYLSMLFALKAFSQKELLFIRRLFA